MVAAALDLVRSRGLHSERDAASFATTLIAATEGAVVLARAERSLEPFEAVAGTLLAQAASLSSPRRRS